MNENNADINRLIYIFNDPITSMRCKVTYMEWQTTNEYDPETRFVLATVMMYLLSIDCLRLGDSADLSSDSCCSLNCVLTRAGVNCYWWDLIVTWMVLFVTSLVIQYRDEVVSTSWLFCSRENKYRDEVTAL